MFADGMDKWTEDQMGPLSPGGRLLCSLLRGPIVFNLGVIGVVKGVWGFKNTGDERPF